MYEDQVRSEWVDYNGHMNDSSYAKVFSLTVDSFMDYIGLDAKARENYNYTIFTLETHLCYLKEAHEDESLHVSIQLLNIDAKRMHVFFEMKNADGNLIATSEQMLMGMDTNQEKPAHFPAAVGASIEAMWKIHDHMDAPKQVGRIIGIKR